MHSCEKPEQHVHPVVAFSSKASIIQARSTLAEAGSMSSRETLEKNLSRLYEVHFSQTLSDNDNHDTSGY